MNVCIYTIDMYAGRERLMPWRTLIEVAQYANSIPGVEAFVCSGQRKDFGTRKYNDVEISSIDKNLASLASFLNQRSVTVLYYPFAFRDIFKSLTPLQRLNCQKIGYIPGGIYPFNGVVALAKEIGWKNARSYVLEKLIPHSIMPRKLKNNGFTHIISFSETTRQSVIKCGWNKENAILALPGLDDFGKRVSDHSVFDKYNLNNKKFILFSGAPAAIRGSVKLLKAFDRFAEATENVDLVMLMRHDNHSDFEDFNAAITGLKHKRRIIVLYDRLSPSQLKCFFEAAYAVVLPFLLIPSEIPLTYFEVLCCGTPVISFENAGTTEYLKNALVISSSRSEKSLAKCIEYLCRNSEYRAELSNNALELMSNHPGWDKFAQQWIKVINRPGV